jgi:hypothetical protein
MAAMSILGRPIIGAPSYINSVIARVPKKPPRIVLPTLGLISIPPLGLVSIM